GPVLRLGGGGKRGNVPGPEIGRSGGDTHRPAAGSPNCERPRLLFSLPAKNNLARPPRRVLSHAGFLARLAGDRGRYGADHNHAVRVRQKALTTVLGGGLALVSGHAGAGDRTGAGWRPILSRPLHLS